MHELFGVLTIELICIHSWDFVWVHFLCNVTLSGTFQALKIFHIVAFKEISFTPRFSLQTVFFFLRRHATPLLKTERSVVWRHTSHKQNNLSIGDVQRPCKNWDSPLRSQLVRNWSLDYYACLQVVVMQITHRRPTCDVCLHSTV